VLISMPTDGVAFVIQSQGPTALGSMGGGLGYGGPIDTGAARSDIASRWSLTGTTDRWL
jgi:hypothetical protein